MKQSNLIWVILVVIVLVLGVVWAMKKSGVTYDSTSRLEYESTSMGDTMVGPEQGMDDLATETESSAALDSSVDSDLQHLDKELQGI
ncbi:MAG: hypothetical protein AAB538_05860 [Patescibacteria group bacterium]